jgi:hypothetical protein
MMPVAASAEIGSLNGTSSYSFFTRGRRLEDVWSRRISLLLAR